MCIVSKDCPNPSRKRARTGELMPCTACVAGFNYAVRKLKTNPLWVKERMGKLNKWTDRMLELGDTEKGKPYSRMIKREVRNGR